MINKYLNNAERAEKLSKTLSWQAKSELEPHILYSPAFEKNGTKLRFGLHVAPNYVELFVQEYIPAYTRTVPKNMPVAGAWQKINGENIFVFDDGVALNQARIAWREQALPLPQKNQQIR